MTETSERAPDPRPVRTREAIFAAARDLSAVDGEVTVRALAAKAKVSRAAFYTHFSGLDELLGAMFQHLFDSVFAQALESRDQGVSVQETIRFGFGMMVAHVERHHAFLRGALDWKSSHRTSMAHVDRLAELHAHALRRLGDGIPAPLEIETTARWLTGGELALIDVWLRDTEQEAHEGASLDATSLLASVLRTAPSWYTGLDPEGPTGAAELLKECRRIESGL